MWKLSPKADRVLYWYYNGVWVLGEAPTDGRPGRHVFETGTEPAHSGVMLISVDGRRAVVGLYVNGFDAVDFLAVSLDGTDPDPRHIEVSSFGEMGEAGEEVGLSPDGRYFLTRVLNRQTLNSWLLRATPLDGTASRFISPPELGYSGRFRFTADGKRVLFANSLGELYVAPLEAGPPIPLSGPIAPGIWATEFTDSPDGRAVVYVAGDGGPSGKLLRVAADGGPSTRLDDPLQSGGHVRDFTFGGDHVVYQSVGALEGTQAWLSGVWSVPLVGGAGRHLTDDPQRREQTYAYKVTPDGQRVLLSQAALSESGDITDRFVLAADLATGQTRRLLAPRPVGAPDYETDILSLQTSTDSNWAAWIGKRFDGQFELVTAELASGRTRIVDVGAGLGTRFALSTDSRQIIHYKTRDDGSGLADVKAAELGRESDSRTILVSRGPPDLRALPDADAVVAFVVSDQGEQVLLRVPLNGSPPTMLNQTTIFGQVDQVVFTGDGENMAYTASQDRMHSDLYLVPAGGGRPRHAPLGSDDQIGVPNLIPAPSGSWILATMGASNAPATYLIDTTDPSSVHRVMVDTEATILEPSFSPDGRTLVFVGGPETGGALFSVPVGGGTPKSLVAGGDISSVQFSPDGRFVFFRQQGYLWWTPIDGSGTKPSLAGIQKSRVGFSPDSRYALFADDQSPSPDPWDYRLVSIRLADGTKTVLSAKDENPFIGSWVVLPGSDRVVFSTRNFLDAKQRKAKLYAVPIAGGPAFPLAAAQSIGTDVGELLALPDGSGIVFVVIDSKGRFVPSILRFAEDWVQSLGMTVEGIWTIPGLWLDATGERVAVQIKKREFESPPFPSLMSIRSIDLKTLSTWTLSDEALFLGVPFPANAPPTWQIQPSSDGRWLNYFESLVYDVNGARTAVFHSLGEPWYRQAVTCLGSIVQFDGHSPVVFDPTSRRVALIGDYEGRGRELFLLNLDPPGPRPTPVARLSLPLVRQSGRLGMDEVLLHQLVAHDLDEHSLFGTH